MTKIRPLKYFLPRLNGVSLYCRVVIATKIKPGENLTGKKFSIYGILGYRLRYDWACSTWVYTHKLVIRGMWNSSVAKIFLYPYKYPSPRTVGRFQGIPSGHGVSEGESKSPEVDRPPFISHTCSALLWVTGANNDIHRCKLFSFALLFVSAGQCVYSGKN